MEPTGAISMRLSSTASRLVVSLLLGLVLSLALTGAGIVVPATGG
jgi:hypothetical protein